MDDVQRPPPQYQHPQQWRLGRLYQWASVMGAILAIIVAPQPSSLALFSEQQPQPAQRHPLSFLFAHQQEEPSSSPKLQTTTSNNAALDEQQPPPPFRWMLSKLQLLTTNNNAFSNDEDHNDDGKSSSSCSAAPSYNSWLDPNIWQANSTAVADKILTSSPRLLLLANFWFVCTLTLPAWIAQLCLGAGTRHSSPPAEPGAAVPPPPTTLHHHSNSSPAAVIFKFLVVSSVVVVDRRQWLDWCVVFVWGATLQFLRALLGHCRAAIFDWVRRPRILQHRAVPLVLIGVLVMDGVAAACCVGLLYPTGYRVVLVLTWECLLVGLDVWTYLLQYWVVVSQEGGATTQGAVLEWCVGGLEFTSDVLTVMHYIHIWRVHGLQWTLVDAVLALELYCAGAKTVASLMRFWKEHELKRDLNVRFSTATTTDLQKADDVCCICLREFNENCKRLECGHLLHDDCLRQVIQRARSLPAARCPLCREPVVGTAPRGTVPPPVPHQPLFRFSTQQWFPNWLPALSLEVVRQDAAVERLATVFPNRDRQELVSILRHTGNVDMAVETILLSATAANDTAVVVRGRGDAED